MGSSTSYSSRRTSTGRLGHAGERALRRCGEPSGAGSALSAAMARARERASAHDPGIVLRRSGCDATPWRRLPVGSGRAARPGGSIRTGRVRLDGVSVIRLESTRSVLSGCTARSPWNAARAWKLGARPERTVLDVDAALTTAHSDKAPRRATSRAATAIHPLLCYLDGTSRRWPVCCGPGDAGRDPPPPTVCAVLGLALRATRRDGA